MFVTATLKIASLQRPHRFHPWSHGLDPVAHLSFLSPSVLCSKRQFMEEEDEVQHKPASVESKRAWRREQSASAKLVSERIPKGRWLQAALIPIVLPSCLTLVMLIQNSMASLGYICILLSYSNRV